MIINQLTLSDNLQELPVSAGKAFPLEVHYSNLGEEITSDIPWHWHSEIEFINVVRGKLRILSAGHQFVLTEGEGCFVNSNVLHRMEECTGNPPIFLSQLLDVSLLGGAYNSVFEQKYLNPVLKCKDLEVLPFWLHNTNHRKILEHIRNSCEAVDAEAEGYEIIARNELSLAWLQMMRELPQGDRGQQTSENPTELRVKKMMIYIQEHYAGKISLEEIASSANISTRECLRNFRQYLHTTPFGYLIDYRLNAAADSLLSTGKSITEIAVDCGFSSGSYFTKLFREKFGMTPMDYRRRGR